MDLGTKVVALTWDIEYFESRYKTIKNSLTNGTSNKKDTGKQKPSKQMMENISCVQLIPKERQHIQENREAAHKRRAIIL